MATAPSVPPELTLPPPATRLARLRSNLIREATSFGMPKSVIFFHGDRSGPKRIALTFDDGPDDMTHRYIELLDRHAARATFFVIGSRGERRPESVRALIAAGHEVASHGFTHKSFPEMGPAELTDELLHCAEVLPPTATPKPMVRPPRGAITARSMARTAASGFTTVMWSLDSDDCRTTNPQDVVEKVTRQARAGEVVLLHEGQEWTLAALETIIPTLRSAGYELVTVGELMTLA